MTKFERWLKLVPTLGDYVKKSERGEWRRAFNQNLTLWEVREARKCRGDCGGGVHKPDKRRDKRRFLDCEQRAYDGNSVPGVPVANSYSRS